MHLLDPLNCTYIMQKRKFSDVSEISKVDAKKIPTVGKEQDLLYLIYVLQLILVVIIFTQGIK